MFSIYVRPFGPFIWLRRRRITEQVQVAQRSLPYRFTHWGIISTLRPLTVLGKSVRYNTSSTDTVAIVLEYSYSIDSNSAK